MKYRNGFVSNSSSSSFVIIDNTPEKEISFIEIMEVLSENNSNDSEETHIEAKGTSEEIMNILRDRYSGYSNFDEDFSSLKESMEKQKDKKFYYIKLSYHDGSTSILQKYVTLGKVEILYDD